MLELWPTWAFSEGLPPEDRSVGKRAAAWGAVGPRAKLNILLEVKAVPLETPLWIQVNLRAREVPALIDTGAQFSCIRAEVLEFLFSRGEPCKSRRCSVSCTLVDGTHCKVRDAVNLHVKLLGFAWDQEFKILPGGPFPVILGLDFLSRTRMVIDVATCKYSFGFAPECSGTLGCSQGTRESEPYLQSLTAEASQWVGGVHAVSILEEFPQLFSPVLGTANCAPYEIELMDPAPVRSPPYRCAPPRLEVFRTMVDELLEQGVLRRSNSPVPSPAFLVSKNGGLSISCRLP